MKETGLTGKRRSTTIAATPDDGNSQRKRRRMFSGVLLLKTEFMFNVVAKEIAVNILLLCHAHYEMSCLTIVMHISLQLKSS